MFASESVLFVLQVRCGSCQDLSVPRKFGYKTACFVCKDIFYEVSFGGKKYPINTLFCNHFSVLLLLYCASYVIIICIIYLY